MGYMLELIVKYGGLRIYRAQMLKGGKKSDAAD